MTQVGSVAWVWILSPGGGGPGLRSCSIRYLCFFSKMIRLQSQRSIAWVATAYILLICVTDASCFYPPYLRRCARAGRSAIILDLTSHSFPLFMLSR